MERGGMQFITALFGGSENTILNSAFALGIVLVLIVLGLWGLKLLTRGTANMTRGRKRVTVVDTAMLDGKRQVVIIRRDNVEHLILTGGPQDMVVEAGIPVETPPPPVRRPGEQAAAPSPAPLGKPEIDKLRAFVRPGAARKSPSLRHTGLLRPVSQGEPAIIPMPPMAGDNAARGKPDSATTAQGTDNGRAAFGAGRVLGDTGEAGSH